MDEDKLKQIQKLLDVAEGNLHSARNLMREIVGAGNVPSINPEERAKSLNVTEGGRIIEGVYNGESMVGPDGKEYPVPANYASKSKLVEGDVLKLTIAEDGSFIFKQINPIERRKTIGTLVYTDGSYTVTADGKTYKVLQASVTYYKGEPGDQVTLILPKDHESTWGAIENIIKHPHEEAASTEPAENQAQTEQPQEPKPEAEQAPEIEYPENNQSTESEETQATSENPKETTETQEQAKNSQYDQDNDKPDEGIKELEI